MTNRVDSEDSSGSVSLSTSKGNTMRMLSLATLATFILTAPIMAQVPTAQNIIPDNINYATQGKLQALDPGAGTLIIAPDNQPPISMTVAPGVNLSGLDVGDVASVHYTRTVTFTTGGPDAAAKPTGTVTVGQAAQNPAPIATNGAVIVGRVLKVDSPDTVEVVNNDGGGVYRLRTTQPARMAAIAKLKAGDSVTVNVSPIVATSVAKCGLFGLGVFGC